MVDLNIKLPDGFLDEEIRCGYTVTHEMKEVWAVELDLLAEFRRVCEKHNLKFFADAGTLLGTVRDKGFIPWDDDIDLCMFRKDYDKLISIANSEFQKPYLLQSYYTETYYPRGHAQFRNTETTCILTYEADHCNARFNQGIFLDVFVLDGVDDDPRQLHKEYKKITFWKKIVNYKTKFVIAKTLKQKLASILIKFVPVNYLSYCKRIDDELRKHSINEFDTVAPLNFIFETKKRARRKELYNEVVWLPFEFTDIPCPTGYDEFLTKRYGDYMKPSQVPTTHGASILDTNHPDSYYLGGGL